MGSNIAVGAGRFGDREFLRFAHIAYASASELAFQLTVAGELGFGAERNRATVAEVIDHLQRMLNSLAKRLNSRRATDRSAGE